jgi:ParB family chromosome partitioning protein
VRDGTYEIIAGERRWRAAQMAGLQQVPAIVTSVTDEEALAFGVIENIQRQDLNPIEEALALNRLIHDFGMTHEQVAKSVGKSRSSVSNTLRLLKLSKIVQDSLISKKIELGHAKALIVLSPDQQDRACQEIIHNKYNSRQVEQLVRKFKSKSNQNMLISHPKVPDWKKSIEYMLQMGVDIKVNEQGKGKVIISVNDAFQVEQIIDSLS